MPMMADASLLSLKSLVSNVVPGIYCSSLALYSLEFSAVAHYDLELIPKEWRKSFFTNRCKESEIRGGENKVDVSCKCIFLSLKHQSIKEKYLIILFISSLPVLCTSLFFFICASRFFICLSLLLSFLLNFYYSFPRDMHWICLFLSSLPVTRMSSNWEGNIRKWWPLYSCRTKRIWKCESISGSPVSQGYEMRVLLTCSFSHSCSFIIEYLEAWVTLSFTTLWLVLLSFFLPGSHFLPSSCFT